MDSLPHLHDPRDPIVIGDEEYGPDPALLSTAGIPAYVDALRACLRGDERVADRCAACSFPRAWHFDTSQQIMLGCDFAARISRRPELRAYGSIACLPIDREPTVSRKVYEALRQGQCGVTASVLVAGFSMDELILIARELTNVVVLAQAQVEDGE